MIWTLPAVDPDFLTAFLTAGEPDQRVIDEYLSRQSRRRQQLPERPGVKRWYYLLRDNLRIYIVTLGMPLEEWQGGAFFIVGTREIIGEFAGNRALTGTKGLHMKMQPLQWMTGQADLSFSCGAQLLGEISEQVLDLNAAERSQRQTRRRYEWNQKKL